MDGPIDYWSQLSNIDIGKQITDSFNAAQQRQALQAQQVQAQQDEARVAAAHAAYDANPTQENYRSLVLLAPKDFEAIKGTFEAQDKATQQLDLQEGLAVSNYLDTDNPEAAKKIIQRRIDAHKAAGRDTSQQEILLNAITSNPKSAKAAARAVVATLVGPEKFGEVFKTMGEDARATELQPGVVKKQTADTAAVNATTNRTIAETGQIAPNAEADRRLKAAQEERWKAQSNTEADRLGLDREKYQSDADLRRQELDQTGGVLPPAGQALVNTAVLNSTSARALSMRASSLADKLATANASGGITAGVVTALTGLTGDASTVTQLRRDYEQLRNQQAIKTLPAGPASDNDIKMALKGFPPATASPETMVSFLRGVSKMQDLVAQDNELQADWLAGNRGSLGPTRDGGFFVGNRLVKPGERFSAIISERNKEQARAAAADRLKPK